MQESKQDTNRAFVQPSAGQGYALFQLAKALTTQAQHPDPATRERAKRRIEEWSAVFSGIVNGTLDVGSRTPLEGVPGWATLKVLTGGFASGELLAAGPLQAHERSLLSRFPSTSESDARRVLNGHCLGEEGLAELQARLQSGCYDVSVPEEAALLVVAWLVQNGHFEQARGLLEALGPWLSRLRFYPVPTDRARRSGTRMFVQNVADTIAGLKRVPPNSRILAQKEAVCVWTPLYDRLVQLFLETVEGETPSLRCDVNGRWMRSASGAFPVQGGWPCRHYPDGWTARAAALLKEYDTQRAEHRRCGRPEDAKDRFSQLRAYSRRCVRDPASLQGRDVGRIRLILACYLTKRGTPDSPLPGAAQPTARPCKRTHHPADRPGGDPPPGGLQARGGTERSRSFRATDCEGGSRAVEHPGRHAAPAIASAESAPLSG